MNWEWEDNTVRTIWRLASWTASEQNVLKSTLNANLTSANRFFTKDNWRCGRFENFESDHHYESNSESEVWFEIESNLEALQVPNADALSYILWTKLCLQGTAFSIHNTLQKCNACWLHGILCGFKPSVVLYGRNMYHKLVMCTLSEIGIGKRWEWRKWRYGIEHWSISRLIDD